MTQAGRYGTNVLIVCNQQCGGGVPKTMQRNHGQRLPVVFVIPQDGIMERLIGGAVIHQLAVLLNKQPFAALPVIAQTQAVAGAVCFHGLYSQGQKMGDRDLSEAVLGFGRFYELLPFGISNGLGNRHNVIFKINIRPFQSQQFALS